MPITLCNTKYLLRYFFFSQQLSMRTEVTANDGNKLFDGKTEIMYCDEDSKKITAEYWIETPSDSSLRLVKQCST